MPSRYFTVSLCAISVSLACSNTTFADDFHSQMLELNQVNDTFHSTADSLALGQLTALTVLPADLNGNPASINMRSASQGVAVLQDRVYFSPAPYSAPQLQLLPNLLQQQSVTVTPMANMAVGGQGAFGVVSYQTLPVAEQAENSKVTLEGNTDADYSVDVNWGVKQKEYGMILAVNYSDGSGADHLLNGQDTDRQTTDILFKINAASLLGARSPQVTEFTYQFLDDDSYRSQLGLTQADWQQDPMSLYSATAGDKHQGRHHKYQLSHQVALSGGHKVITDFYYQSYSQQLNQLNQFDGQVLDTQGLAALAAFERQPTVDGVAVASLQQDNDFSSFGVQTESVNQYGAHQISYSARYHTDKAEMHLGDQQSLWQQDLSVVSDAPNALLAYTDDATAFTSAIDSLFNWDGLQLKLALAYEKVDVNRKVNLAYAGLEAADFSDSDWMPQLGVLYHAGDWRFSTDIRRSWTAASAGNIEQEAQVSLQYQVSAQYASEHFSADIKTYVRDFDNLHVNCDAYTQCADSRLWVQGNVVDVLTKGVELNLGYQWELGSVQLPLALNYQYSNAEYQTNSCNEIQGCVVAGDRVAWLPEQQLQLSAGMKYAEYELHANVFYQSEREMGQFGAQLQPVAAQWRVDLAANYHFNRHHEIYFRIENLLDETLVTTASNSGIRSENGRISYLGYQWRF
ncbi:TonB-dependent receptor [Shewanella baltica OS625]|uniref:TonB-dependent receptor domain-containing protein n=1 Tax=Shewanella baltica TaxID=62322 RepID=UPI000230D85D|nr:TonB-dependent receptor [Shewanella baltica]EHC07771.1 TonB-dependent receptor [Shewanella baltica OS625]